jgi:hypothetical protein
VLAVEEIGYIVIGESFHLGLLKKGGKKGVELPKPVTPLYPEFASLHSCFSASFSIFYSMTRMLTKNQIDSALEKRGEKGRPNSSGESQWRRTKKFDELPYRHTIVFTKN